MVMKQRAKDELVGYMRPSCKKGLILPVCNSKEQKVLKTKGEAPCGTSPFSGESGIRTHGDISATLDFESSALDQLSHLSMRRRSRCGGIMPW